MLSIPEIATQIIDKCHENNIKNNYRTIFFVGSKNVGKSTVLYSFLEKTDVPRETLVLEYSFGRKTNQKQGIEKMLCHIWEYGGKLETLNSVLHSVPINGKFYFCIMVDLSKIKSIWETLETCVQSIQNTSGNLDNLPEFVIIGGKYDVFKNYDSEIKKIICVTLRSVALQTNASTLFYSTKDPQLTWKAKEMLHNIGFGNSIPIKEKNTNFTKPLFIPKGSDSWENLGIGSSTMEQIKARHMSQIPSHALDSETSLPTPTPLHLHSESHLDSIIKQKYGELQNIDSFDIAIDYLPTLELSN